LASVVDAKGDANHSHHYGNMTVVATSGGEYANPVEAVTDLANWCGTPAPDNPCLIEIKPGIYNTGGAALSLPAFVNIKGSGEHSTIIQGPRPMISGFYDNTPMIELVNSEISDLTINCLGDYSSNSYVTAVRVSDEAGALTMRNVSVNVISETGVGWYTTGIYSRGDTVLENVKVTSTNNTTGGTRYNHAISLNNCETASLKNVKVLSNSTNPGYLGSLIGINIYAYQATPAVLEIEDVDIEAQNGVSATLSNTQLFINDVNTDCDYGIYTHLENSSNVYVKNSDVSTFSINAGGNAYVSNTTVRGGMDAGGGSSYGAGIFICSNVIDGNYAPVTCPQ
jgi:hypothetical protein